MNVLEESPAGDLVFDEGTKTITKYTGTEDVVVIPSTIGDVTVEHIGEDAFNDCDEITNIVIPSSVTTIGDGVFYGCENLTSITIPHSVNSIGENMAGGCTVFDGCTRLQSINVDGSNTAYSSVDGVLLNNAQTELIRCPQGKEGSYTIPSGVTSIWEYAFYDCENLTSITIPNSMASISFNAFAYCTGLISVIFQETSKVTIIKASAFIDCQSLSSITIPNSVKAIDSCAFSGCIGLKSITIGAGVTIGNSLLTDVNNNFRDAYTAAGGGAGTYTAVTYDGEWTKVVDPAVVNASALDTLVAAPVKDAITNTTAINETQYSGTIAWFESDGTTSVAGNFAASTVYVAKVTLTAKAGYTLTGVAANSFTYTGATSVANEADLGEVTITFPATAAAPKEITGFTPLTDVTLDTDKNLVDLDALKASGKLPTTVEVTDGTTPTNATITDWTGTFDGTTTGVKTLTAVWTMPAGYADATEPISVTITVNVNTAQTVDSTDQDNASSS